MSGSSGSSGSATESNRALVAEAFQAWESGDSRPFFALVADDVRWTVIGSTGISGTFTSKAAFVAGATSRLYRVFADPLIASVRRVLADGDHVVLQWDGRTRSKGGVPYEQTYCWVLRLVDGRIVEAEAYLDTELVTAMLREE